MPQWSSARVATIVSGATAETALTWLVRKTHAPSVSRHIRTN